MMDNIAINTLLPALSRQIGEEITEAKVEDGEFGYWVA